MGYLIGGAGEEAQSEIVAEGSEYSNLTDEQLLELHRKTVNEVTKWSNFQMVRKIQINSLYGALGNQYFRHYKLDNAEAITLTGQVAIRGIERKVNEFLNKCLKTEEQDYVIASDTDSIYLNLGPLVDTLDDVESQRIVDVLNKFSDKVINPFIDESYDELSEYLQCYEKTLVMKRECIAEKGIWTAKKRYILNVWDNEGVRYKEPKLKMMGIEAVKSSTPAPCRTYIKECLNLIMTGTEQDVINYIESRKQEHAAMDPPLVSFPRTANNISKFKDHNSIYKKSTPIHVRGCLMFNHRVKEMNLSHKYNFIEDGEKVKFAYLKTPNPIGENIISFINELPKEFGLHPFLDYDMMYTKGFIDPLKGILDTIGWKTEHVATLEDFFS